MASRLDTLLKQNQQMGKKRREMRQLQKDLQPEINALLEEAEAERKAHPTQAAPPQTVG